jgi:hypothetical protein
MPDSATTRLYDLVDKLYRLAPWSWMEETNLIALRHPQTGEVAYLSVMGQLGDHRAVAVYLGQEAIERFNLMNSEDPGTQQDGIRLVLESRQLQVSFNERASLSKAALAEIKALGRKYRGEAWPQMRSYHPGIVPEPINEAETLWLTMALEQLLEVTPRLRSDPGQTLRTNDLGALQILSRQQTPLGEWVDVWIPHHSADFAFPSPPCDAALATKVKAHSKALNIECLFTLLPNPMGPKGGRCVYPYLMMAVGVETGFIFGVELLSVEKQTFEELIASVPDRFLRLFDKAGIRPLSLDCASVATEHLLHHAAKALGIEVECYEELPMLDKIVASMPL